MSKKIIFEEPTTSKRNGTRASKMRAYVNALSKHPDRWAIYARSAKSATYFYQIAKEFPNLRISTRMNPDGKTMRVYFMWVSKPTSSIKRGNQHTTAKSKTIKPIKKSVKSR